MKRPKFFEDLDRSLAGEPESEPPAEIGAREDAEIRVRALQNLWQRNAALLAAHNRCVQTEAEIAQQAAMMQQFDPASRQRMEMQAMIAINVGRFNAACVSSLASSSIDYFPYEWRRR